MNRYNSFLKKTSLVFLSKIINQFFAFLLIPIYTFYLSSQEYGLVDLITTYISLFVPIVSLQLDSAVFRFLIDSRNNQKESKIIISNTFSILLVMIIITLILSFIINIFYDIPYLFLITINIILSIIFNILLQIERGLNNTKQYCIYLIINSFINFLVIVCLLFFKVKILSVLIGMIISNLICIIGLAIHINIFKYLNLKLLEKKEIKKLLKYSFPLIPNTFCWWLINVSDRSIITLFLGLSATGIYAVGCKLSTIITRIFSIINITFTETIAENINKKDLKDYYNNSMCKLISIIGGLTTIFISFIALAFNWLFSQEYNTAYNLIPFLVLGAFMSGISSFLGSYFIAKKNTNVIMKTSILASIINILINFLFIKRYGIIVAALSTIISYLVISIIRYIIINKNIKLHLITKETIFITSLFILSIIGYYIKSYPINIILLTINLIILFLIFKKDIFRIIKKTKI